MIDTVNSIKMTTYTAKEDMIWTQDFNVLFKKERLTEFFPTKNQSNTERINAIVRLALYASIVLCIYHSSIKYSSIFIFFLFFTFIIYKHHPEINTKIVEINKIDLTTQEQVQLDAEKMASSQENNTSLNNFTPSFGLNASKKNLGELISQDGKTEQGVGIMNNTIEKFEGETRGEQNNKTCTAPTLDNPFMNATMKDYMNFDSNGSIVDRPAACDPNDPEIKGKIDENFNNNLFKDVNDVFGKGNSQRQFFTMPYTTIPNNQDEFARWLYLSPSTCKENQDNCLNYEDLRGKPFIMPNQFRNPNSTEARLK